MFEEQEAVAQQPLSGQGRCYHGHWHRLDQCIWKSQRHCNQRAEETSTTFGKVLTYQHVHQKQTRQTEASQHECDAIHPVAILLESRNCWTYQQMSDFQEEKRQSSTATVRIVAALQDSSSELSFHPHRDRFCLCLYYEGRFSLKTFLSWRSTFAYSFASRRRPYILETCRALETQECLNKFSWFMSYSSCF